MTRKICVVTGSRAEYGLLKLVMQEIKDDPELVLQVVVTGMHLSSKYGDTYKEILQDGFLINNRAEILNEDNSSKGVSNSIGLGIEKFGAIFDELKPDFVLVLGDRFEIFAAVISAHVALIPVIHLHGGELTEGAFDDSFRHSITKMSYLHFVATREYAKRVIQLGEQPESVTISGGLGVDVISKVKLFDKSELESKLKFNFGKKNLLITFHPTTLEPSTAKEQITELLLALSKLNGTNLYFTLPNADPGSQEIKELILNFVNQNKNARSYSSLGQQTYLSCIPHMDGVVGNSSSGLMEVPSFRKGTINIGDRQRGRVQAESVINCKPYRVDILAAIMTLYSQEFQKKLLTVSNPYGTGGASKKIISKIKNIDINIKLKKSFYNIDFTLPPGDFYG
jgi:GDP/UDP-N,N'-diacetylbacillosamine 2-epimerase (hydrolysing)